jgi:thioredoxin reductase/Pyruvate/2-oxoacid:ferredoxin oxidoreductase delta subunit
MDIFEIAIYSITAIFVVFVFIRYLRKFQQLSHQTQIKVETAQKAGRYEPLSLYPYIDPHKCIGSGACVTACPEKDVLGIMNGRGTLINTTSCIGHGACFLACPVDAISLRIGTEKRGVELPHIKPDYETNVDGIFVAGELGGMGLIKNSIEQGISAVNGIKAKIDSVSYVKPNDFQSFDLVIVGSGPAGIGAALRAKELNLNYIVFEQDSLGGTVFTYPRGKIVMTHPVHLPLYGEVKMEYTSKEELLDFWIKIREKYQLNIQENTKVDSIRKENDYFESTLQGGEKIFSKSVLLAIGRRGSPRKLNIPGELSTHVAYRLIEADEIQNERIMVVGGGDSAIEAALMLKDQNQVFLSYRKSEFARIKALNEEKIQAAISSNQITAIFNSELKKIEKNSLEIECNGLLETMENIDKVYIFAGGELPTQFLKNAGVDMEIAKNKIIKSH